MDFGFDHLNIGTKIDIMKTDDLNETVYPSKVLDILDKDKLVISGPIKKSDLVLMHKNEYIQISYNVEEKGNYYFDAKIISRKYSNVYTLTVQKISDIKKIQLRNHYRLSVRLNVYKEYLTREGNKVETLIETCEAKDISGGGMKLYCNYKHSLGDEIICTFEIGEESVKVRAKVIRVEELEEHRYKLSLGICFLEISEENREAIIRYIFEKQRILRLKGLI